MKYTEKDEKRFWDKVLKSDDCWTWTSQTRGGYGMFSLHGKPVSAHRFSYYIHTGELPVTVRHTCDSPPCVNPAHLAGGTHKDNSDDKFTRDRHRGVLSNNEILEIRQMEMSVTIIADVAKKYGISEHNARCILNGRTFSHRPGARSIVKQRSRSKLSIDEIHAIKEELKNPWWGQVNHLASKYNVSHSEISHIKNGKIHAEK